jgi:anti-anti-sigma factor
MNPPGGPTSRGELRLGRLRRSGGDAVLAVAGEVDMTTGDRFRQALALALTEPDLDRLTIDLGPLRFIDSAGVSTLLWAQQTAAERDVTVAITNADGAIRSILELLGVYEMLTTPAA